ncbi:MAG TPA: glycoside hydrolase family 1 protein [Candidatus Saccharimonadales bacterium]|nr:glycoside hydrolase family 1 protein [Candidatus Saccharimonadales bacterium]
MPEDTEAEFPKDFMWGASTSAHQVEGNTNNQWTRWEMANADKLAATAEQRLHHMPFWHEVKDRAQMPSTYISGKGIDHYNRYEEDFDLLKKLNLNAFRFGIEWARLEPEEGVWDEKEVEHYRDYIKAMRDRGIEPVLNIWHWTHPLWFEDMGAFKNKANLKHFDRFVSKLVNEYGSMVTYYITVNEPNTYTASSYLTVDLLSGLSWPPGEKKITSAFKVYRNLVRAHRRAYKIIKAADSRARIGIAASLDNIQAKDPHDLPDEISTKIMRYIWDWWFLRRIGKYQDFIGINYYFTDYYDGLFKKSNPSMPVSELGWYMEPEGLYPLLLRAWAHYKKPIIVSENGVADAHDEYRRWWIEETIVAMERAISQGVKIIGYFHWSLLDNFEWATGWLPKFGLVEVDRQHGMKRTIRPSAKWFAEKITKLTIPK